MTIRKWARDKNVPESKESSFKHTCSCGCGKEGTVQVSNKWYNVDCKKRILGW
jgi:hypothetical protein